jgi:hypothetical protein
MAKKPAPKTTTKIAPKKTAAAPVAARAASRAPDVRNSPVPKKVNGAATAAKSVPQRGEVTREMIAQRAHEIAHSGTGGSDLDNWLRAERELLGS